MQPRKVDSIGKLPNGLRQSNRPPLLEETKKVPSLLAHVGAQCSFNFTTRSSREKVETLK